MLTANFGIDAPPVIKQLSFTGFCFFVAAVIVYYFFHPYFQLMAALISSLLGVFGLMYGVFALLMILSSRRGKYKVASDLVASLCLMGDEKILDVGCGRGLLAITIAKKLSTGRVTGIDIWRQEDQSNNSQDRFLKNAKAEGVEHAVEIVTCDMQHMPFPDHTFDIVVSSLAIHNIENSEGRKRALREITRVLKPMGKIALLDFQYTDEYKKYLKKLGWKNIVLTRHDFRMFPPVRVVHASILDNKIK